MARVILMLAVSLLAVSAVHAQNEAMLSVNHSPVDPGDSADILMGELDPNVVSIDGPENGRYILWGSRRGAVTGGSKITVSNALGGRRKPLPALVGRLDDTGHAELVFTPGDFSDGDEFNLIVAVTNPDVAGITFSGTARVSVVRSMSSPINLSMPAGSIARVYAPLIDSGPDFVTVVNLTFDVTSATELGNFDEMSDLEDLAEDEWLQVAGEFNASGGFVALKLNIEDAAGEIRLRGRVQGIGPAGFCLLGVSVYVSTESNLVDDESGLDADFDDLEEGMVVEVRVPAEVLFPHVVEGTINMSTENEPEEEPEEEPEPEEESEWEFPPSFCS